MKLAFALIFSLSILSFVRAQDMPAQLPSDGAKPPVRTQPFGELLQPATPLVSPPVAATVRPLAKPPATPPALIAAALDNRDVENRLTGRGMTLVEALSYANSPQRQLDVIHAYWHLVSSVASYNLECRLLRKMEDLRGSAADSAAIQTALASSSAAREEARCVAISAQHSLAEAAMSAVDDSLPLPTNVPHVGAYRTRFAEIFSARPAPPRLILIDRTLPIHCKAIDARARAIAAAEKSLQVATADFAAGRCDLQRVVSCIAKLNRQHLALVDTVCNYNHEIVEYAVASLAQPISGPALVSRLIETKQGDATHFDPRMQPASAVRPLDGRISGQSPTLAPPRTGGRLNAEPHTLPPTLNVDPMQPPQRFAPSGREPIQINPQSGPAVHKGLLLDPPAAPEVKEPPRIDLPQNNMMQTRPVVPVRTTNKPVTVSRLYAALASASPADRARHLVETLHGVRNLPADNGRPIKFADYLGLGQGINRQALVEAFWLSRQRSAEFQVLAQQSQLLDEIQVPQSQDLDAARPAAEADTIDAHIRLLESQFLLTNLVGKASEPAWLTASGLPRFTDYGLAQVQAGADTWELRRRRAMIPAIQATICSHAVAVVEADAARADAIAQGDGGLEAALDRTFRQTEETLAFLASVTAYNNAVARYVLRVSPEISNQMLAEKLLAGS